MKPQSKPSHGPWFEGWYIRVTDPETQRSFALITTSSTVQKSGLSFDSIMPGYLAFLYDLTPGGQTHSVEYFPQKTWVETSGPDLPADSDFKWTADGYGFLSEHEAQMKLPTGDEVSFQLGKRMPWSKNWSDWGPEGWASFFSFLPLKWYVDSLGTPTEYRLKIAATGEVITGHGYAHIEKNWGRAFPLAWMWLQATSEDNSSHLAMAGGPLSIGPINYTTYLIGYKTKTLDLEIRPDQALDAQYETQIDPCRGTFFIQASNSYQKILIKAQAPLDSFAPVSIPTVAGYEKNGGIESFSSQIQVKAYEGDVLLEEQTFQGAALEFGAADMKCQDPARVLTSK